MKTNNITKVIFKNIESPHPNKVKDFQNFLAVFLLIKNCDKITWEFSF